MRRCVFFAGTGLRLDRAGLACAASLLFFAVLVLPADRVEALAPDFAFVAFAAFAASGRRLGAALRCAVLPATPRRAVAAAFFAPAFFAPDFFAGVLRALVFFAGRFALVAIVCSCS